MIPPIRTAIPGINRKTLEIPDWMAVEACSVSVAEKPIRAKTPLIKSPRSTRATFNGTLPRPMIQAEPSSPVFHSASMAVSANMAGEVE